MAELDALAATGRQVLKTSMRHSDPKVHIPAAEAALRAQLKAAQAVRIGGQPEAAPVTEGERWARFDAAATSPDVIRRLVERFGFGLPEGWTLDGPPAGWSVASTDEPREDR